MEKKEIEKNRKNDVVRCQIYNSFDELVNLKNEWDSFVQSVEGDIYLSFDWCHIWWEYYGNERQLAIFIYYKEEKIVGLCPFFIENIFFGTVTIKLAKLIGSDYTISMVNPPIREDLSKEIFSQSIDRLLKLYYCDAIWLGPIGSKYNILSKLRSAINDNPNGVLYDDYLHAPYTSFCMPETFEEYTKKLSKNNKKNLRRVINLFNKSFNTSYDIIRRNNEIKTEYSKFVKMHNEQWNSVGKLGHFNDWPKGNEFNYKLAMRFAKLGRLRLIKLIANKMAVSYELCYCFGKRWYHRLPARVTGTEWDKYALGRLGVAKIVECAIDEGINEIEAGAGHYDYKIKLGGDEHSLYKFIIVRNNIISRIRTAVFFTFCRLLHLLYYRIWFNRLRPKLRLKPKPLWKIWIRTRY